MLLPFLANNLLAGPGPTVFPPGYAVLSDGTAWEAKTDDRPTAIVDLDDRPKWVAKLSDEE